jgi:hypothetical protein
MYEVDAQQYHGEVDARCEVESTSESAVTKESYARALRS